MSFIRPKHTYRFLSTTTFYFGPFRIRLHKHSAHEVRQAVRHQGKIRVLGLNVPFLPMYHVKDSSPSVAFNFYSLTK